MLTRRLKVIIDVCSEFELSKLLTTAYIFFYQQLYTLNTSGKKCFNVNKYLFSGSGKSGAVNGADSPRQIKPTNTNKSSPRENVFDRLTAKTSPREKILEKISKKEDTGPSKIIPTRTGFGKKESKVEEKENREAKTLSKVTSQNNKDISRNNKIQKSIDTAVTAIDYSAIQDEEELKTLVSM